MRVFRLNILNKIANIIFFMIFLRSDTSKILKMVGFVIFMRIIFVIYFVVSLARLRTEHIDVIGDFVWCTIQMVWTFAPARSNIKHFPWSKASSWDISIHKTHPIDCYDICWFYLILSWFISSHPNVTSGVRTGHKWPRIHKIVWSH